MIIRRDSGQIALILVLVMTVIASATVALSARTTIETRVQEINVDSSQAMLAAESGLERVLKSGATSGDLDGSTSFTATDNPVLTGDNVFQGLKQGESIEVYTGGVVNPATSLTINWKPVGNDATFKNRAIFVSRIDSSGAINDYGYKAHDATYSPAGDESGFAVAAVGDTGYTDKVSIPLSVVAPITTRIIVRVLGGDVDLKVDAAGGNIPDQLRQNKVVGIVTRGKETVDESDDVTVKYGVDYRQSENGEVPEVFQYALFSGQSISQ